MATIAFELPVTMEYVEMKIILATMEINKGNKTKTAKDLGIAVRTVYTKMRDHERREYMKEIIHE